MGHKPELKDQLLSKPLARWAIALGVVGALATGGSTLYSLNLVNQRPTKPSPSPSSQQTPKIEGVTALGRLEPEGEVIQLSAPNSLQGARVAQVLVSQGDEVRANQVVAVLDSRDRLQTALERAKKQVQVAQANLDKVRAGAKTGVIVAQEATIKRLQAESKGEKEAQQTTVNRLQTQRLETEKAQDAIAKRLAAELSTAREAQDAIVKRLEAELSTAREAQEAIVKRLAAELNSVRTDFTRYEQLAKQGAISASELDNRRLRLDTAIERLSEAQANRNQTLSTLKERVTEAQANRNQTLTTLKEQIAEAAANRNQTLKTLDEQLKEAKVKLNKTTTVLDEQINEAKANLEQIKEIRPVDIQQAKAEVESAQAAVEQAEAELEQAYIRAPLPGRIIKINTRAGETIDEKEGIAELGQTDRMVVVAEVYESDISKVRVGQRVSLTSENKAFEGELRGSVSKVGLKIGKKDVLSTDPAADTDARVVEVNIRLNSEDSKRVAGLTFSKVIVEIFL